MSGALDCRLADEAATVALGKRIGEVLGGGLVVYLEGELGVGKTTFCRGVLRAMGFDGAVKSPTYTLVEPYEQGDRSVYHFDLYRLRDPEELEFMGIRDYFREKSVCLVEWPLRGLGVLPTADIVVAIEPEGSGRRARVVGASVKGKRVLEMLSAG